MSMPPRIEPALAPPLDAGFVPAEFFFSEHERQAKHKLALALRRPDGTCLHRELAALDASADMALEHNYRALERTLKHMLWTQGGTELHVAPVEAPAKSNMHEHVQQLAARLGSSYASGGERAFDDELVGRKIFRAQLEVHSATGAEALPPAKDRSIPLGRHLSGCRVGFDLGGSDRKAAAVIDGEVVFSEEITWDPYFQSDPQYHYEGIKDSIARAAAKLPRLDAIGGSAAGVYVDNEPRAASLFRGVSDADFETQVRPIFRRLRADFGNVPFELVNDGEVTALAASMSLDSGSILGISMGTSMAAGYVDREGHITSWLNELAFAPVDLREDAPHDEWSGDVGCGVQCFSQQAVARLAPAAGIELPEDMPFAERLVEVQQRMQRGEEGAEQIFTTIGRYLGWSIPWYARTYELSSLLILGRVTSGPGGERILAEARHVLDQRFATLSERITMTTPDEKMKRHGQAIAAASLPALA
jgi:predicted NBD/HSP70 family sugar kinase